MLKTQMETNIVRLKIYGEKNLIHNGLRWRKIWVPQLKEKVESEEKISGIANKKLIGTANLQQLMVCLTDMKNCTQWSQNIAKEYLKIIFKSSRVKVEQSTLVLVLEE
jgi:hypothetical protein